jgi:hypothetical protein
VLSLLHLHLLLRLPLRLLRLLRLLRSVWLRLHPVWLLLLRLRPVLPPVWLLLLRSRHSRRFRAAHCRLCNLTCRSLRLTGWRCCVRPRPSST